MDPPSPDPATRPEPSLPRLTAPLRAIGLLRPYASDREIESYRNAPLLVRLVTALVCTLPLLAAAAALWVATLPVDELKALVDGAATDGSAETFPVERLALIKSRLWVAALGWVALGLVAFYLRYRFPGPVRNGVREILALVTWLRGRLHRLPLVDRVHSVLLCALTLAVAVAVFRLFDETARTDEAATYMAYISKPWFYIVSVYSQTNNHVLHNLLAHFSTRVFGEGMAAARVPSFVAGVLFIPLAYVAVRRHHGRGAALLTASMLASSTLIIDGAAIARGYQMMLVVFVAVIAALPSMVRGEQWAWLAFVVLLATGFWIVPVTLYPALIVGVWLLIARFRDQPKNPKSFLVRLAVAVVSVVVIVVSLYSPAQVVTQASGVLSDQSAFGSRPTTLGALLDIRWRLSELERMWSYGRPAALHYLMLLGVLACPFVAHRTGPFGARLMWAPVVAIIGAIAVMKTFPPFWSLSFIYLVFAINAAVGIAGLVTLIPWSARARHAAEIGLAVVIAAFSVGATFDREVVRDVPWYMGYVDSKAVVEVVGDDLLSGAMLDTSLIWGHGITYYLWRRDREIVHHLRYQDVEEWSDRVLVPVPPYPRPAKLAEVVQRWESNGYVRVGPGIPIGESTIIEYLRSP